MIINLADGQDHHDDCDHGWISTEQGLRRCPACGLAAYRAAVPPRFRKEIELPPAIEAWAGTSGSLYLCGPVGTGKTQYAWAASVAWAQQHRTRVRLVQRATSLFDELRPGNDHRSVIGDCQRAPLLVIDDLGVEKASDWTRERLYEIVDDRYAYGRPMLVTSNLRPSELADHVGERVASRFAEMCDVVPVTGADRRKLALAQRP